MSESRKEQSPASKPGLYQEITDKIIRQIEAGILPWVQPWASDQTLSIPRNATTNRAYSGVNILLLWDALFERNFSVNRWLTFKQALQFGGNVRKGERGTTVVYADTFTPKKYGTTAGTAPASGDGEDSGRRVPFLKRFTVFNVAQCDGPSYLTVLVAIIGSASLQAALAASRSRSHGEEEAYPCPGNRTPHPGKPEKERPVP
jgi:antirestriction protein ArdC